MQFFDLEGDRTLRAYARALDADADYRVLRRLPTIGEVWLAPTPPQGPAIRLAVVDTETTGLGADARMIELAVVKMALDEEGQVCEISPPLSALEDPGIALTPAVEMLTGISTEMLVDKAFNEELLAHHLDDVDVLVAFNAAFDARFWRHRFPRLRHPWICALRDYDWASTGHTERTQAAIWAAKGHFYPAHRAASDTWALAMLLATQAADGRTVAVNLIDAGRQVDYRVSAVNAPFGKREPLKERGYRWDSQRRVWKIDVRREGLEAELLWLDQLFPLIRPAVEEVDWFSRHIG